MKIDKLTEKIKKIPEVKHLK
jgi:hypothetical protein